MNSISTLRLSKLETKEADYERLAAAYYDRKLHPTCHALRQASILSISRLTAEVPLAGVAVELGAGKTIIPECFPEWQSRFHQIFLVDSSQSMLDYSRPFMSSDATLLLEDVTETSIAPGVGNLVIASLGDPYNRPALWFEIARLLGLGGIAIFTTPSIQWVTAFRQDGQSAPPDAAEFLLPNGDAVHVPSLVLPPMEQEQLIVSSGLIVDAIAEITPAESVEAAFAPKLAAIPSTTPFLTAYRVRRP